jgi:hypothetical protein
VEPVTGRDGTGAAPPVGSGVAVIVGSGVMVIVGSGVMVIVGSGVMVIVGSGSTVAVAVGSGSIMAAAGPVIPVASMIAATSTRPNLANAVASRVIIKIFPSSELEQQETLQHRRESSQPGSDMNAARLITISAMPTATVTTVHVGRPCRPVHPC